jgi:uncharacterized protein (UPF0276 family)
MSSPSTHPLVGFTYRTELHDAIMAHREEFEVLEVIADQFIGAPSAFADPILLDLSRFTVVMHSLNLSVGSAHGCRSSYIDGLAYLANRVRPLWCSDHLCFTQSPELELGQLTPLPFTQEACETVCRNLKLVRGGLPGWDFLLENITNYIRYPLNDFSESEFIRRVLHQSGAGLLLDLNNVFVNSVNYHFDPFQFVDELAPCRIRQVHLAGHRDTPHGTLDSHDVRVSDEVWRLLDHLLNRHPVDAITLEWDCDFPPFAVIIDELRIARELANSSRRMPSCR